MVLSDEPRLIFSCIWRTGCRNSSFQTVSQTFNGFGLLTGGIFNILRLIDHQRISLGLVQLLARPNDKAMNWAFLSVFVPLGLGVIASVTHLGHPLHMFNVAFKAVGNPRFSFLPDPDNDDNTYP